MVASAIYNETPVSIREASDRLPGKPHASTIHRWHTTGLRGVVLDTFMVGGRRFTTLEAIARFIEKSTEARDGKRLPRLDLQEAAEEAGKMLDNLWSGRN